MEETKDTLNKTVQFFSDNCRNAPRVSFKVSYTATKGNTDIYERFQEFCYLYSNNEYLAGIDKLLDAFNAHKDKSAMENYLKFLEQRIIEVETKMQELKVEKKEEVKEIKTF